MQSSVARAFLFFISLLLFVAGRGFSSTLELRRSQIQGLCAQLIRPLSYPCSEYTVETRDGYRLAIQRIPYGRGGITAKLGPPVFLQHGLFQAFWNWSWQELAQYDLADMINFVYSATETKIFFVGHSQGTIMALAAFTQPYIVDMVSAAALLCPISYLGHTNSLFVLRAVSMHLDQMLLAMGIHQLNFRSDMRVQILELVCDGLAECSDLLSTITGKNCCFNNSRVDFYLEYEPHPSSTKNMKHLFQMIRKGTFSMFDYGVWGNLKRYGTRTPRIFNLSEIPGTLALWMAYGGNDALADLSDFEHTLKELQSEPELLYLDSYGHLDFIWSTNAKYDVYDKMIEFFRSRVTRSGY